MHYLLSLLIAFSICITPAVAQHTVFKHYIDQAHHFSVDLPSTWLIKYSKLQDGYICVPTTPKEKAEYKDCFEGIIFRLEFYSKGLDSTLLDEQLYTKRGNDYYTSDKESDSVKAENIKGPNWVGIYHDNVCGINCDGGYGSKGRCQFIYFATKNRTICIDTNGAPFDDVVLKRILSSFRFI